MTDSIIASAHPVIVRYAPSPTGKLHLGNARPALLNWLFVRQRGGTYVLRLDDTDLVRSTEESAAGIHRDLAWLGIVPDVVVSQGADASDPYAEFDEREANLPHHLEAEGAKPAPAPKTIQPPAGKKFDDFQLSYAVSMLAGGPVVADADTKPVKPAPKKGAN